MSADLDMSADMAMLSAFIARLEASMEPDDVETLEASMVNLTFDGYPLWSTKMKSILKKRGFWGIVVGNEEADNERDSLAKATIFRWVDPQSPLLDVGSTLSAKKAWDALEEWHKGVCRAQRFSYRSEICSLKKLEKECITNYIMRAMVLTYRLKAAGLPVPEEELAIHVLQGLPKEYVRLVTELETSSESHSLLSILPKLREVEAVANPPLEADREVTEEQAEGQDSSLRGNQRRARGPRHVAMCWECGDMGHTRADCWFAQCRPNPRN